MNCPLCDNVSIKVIYYGFPVRLCQVKSCSCLFGFWSNITVHFPFNGVLFPYDGFYLTALLKWLFTGVAK